MQTAPKKVINGWAMYDWANSVYNLVITSTIFPAYYEAVTGDGNENTIIDIMMLNDVEDNWKILLLMGIDQLLDMGRSATNVVGNAVATVVVSKWESELN